MASSDTRSEKAIHPSEAQRGRHMDIGMALKDSPGGASLALAARSVDTLQARRFDGISRPYTSADVERLRGSVRIAYTLASPGVRQGRDGGLQPAAAGRVRCRTSGLHRYPAPARGGDRLLRRGGS